MEENHRFNLCGQQANTKQKEIKAVQQATKIEFTNYFGCLDKRLSTVNNDQLCILKKKYRFFLETYESLQEKKIRLQEKYHNLQNLVNESQAIVDQQQSIESLEQIVADSKAKLESITERMTKVQQQKQKHENCLINLKQILTSEKDHFFNLKRQELSFCTMLQEKNKLRQLSLASQRFKSIISTKKMTADKNSCSGIRKNTVNFFSTSTDLTNFKKTGVSLLRPNCNLSPISRSRGKKMEKTDFLSFNATVKPALPIILYKKQNIVWNPKPTMVKLQGNQIKSGLSKINHRGKMFLQTQEIELRNQSMRLDKQNSVGANVFAKSKIRVLNTIDPNNRLCSQTSSASNLNSKVCSQTSTAFNRCDSRKQSFIPITTIKTPTTTYNCEDNRLPSNPSAQQKQDKNLNQFLSLSVEQIMNIIRQTSSVDSILQVLQKQRMLECIAK